jgi:hypothetical protein
VRWFIGKLPWVLTLIGLLTPILALFLQDTPWIPLWIILASLAAFGLGGMSLYLLRHRSDAAVSRAWEFFTEIGRARYLLLASLIVGGLFASVLMLVSILISLSPTDFTALADGEKPIWAQGYPWREQYPAAIGALLSGVATILVIGLFYRRLAPYTDLWELIAEIQHDIRRGEERGGLEIWWSYPGLGLGRYRSLDDSGAPNLDNRLYDPFERLLRRLFSEPEVKINAVVYNDHCLKAFYAAYHYQAGNQAAKKALPASNDPVADAEAYTEALMPLVGHDRVARCVRDEHRIAHVGETFQQENNNVYRTKQPDALPATVIVIGDVVYQITNYGSPIYISSNAVLDAPFSDIKGLFVPQAASTRDRLVHLVAFRRHDQAFATAVGNHLQRHVDAALKLGLVTKNGDPT